MSQHDSEERNGEGNSYKKIYFDSNPAGRSIRSKISGMGRRRLLKYLSSIGLGSMAAAGVGSDKVLAETDDPRTEVPIVVRRRHQNHDEVTQGKKPIKEPVIKTVPRDIWAQRTAALNASNNLSQIFDSEFIYVYVTPNDSQNGTRFEIIGDYAVREWSDGTKSKPSITYDEFKQKLPETTSGTAGEGNNQEQVTNIPVTPRKSTYKETAYKTVYRPVPAGVANQRPSSCTGGTIATPAYDDSANEPGWITAAHVVNRSSGVNLHQPYCFSGQIGTSTTATSAGEGDVAFIKSSGPDRKYDVGASGGGYEGWFVYGEVTEQGILDLMDNNTTVYQQGKTSGRNSTKIDALNGGSNCGDDPAIVSTTNSSSNGDSGGPIFHRVSDEVYPIATVGGNGGDGTIYATALYWAEDCHSMIV